MPRSTREHPCYFTSGRFPLVEVFRVVARHFDATGLHHPVGFLSFFKSVTLGSPRYAVHPICEKAVPRELLHTHTLSRSLLYNGTKCAPASSVVLYRQSFRLSFLSRVVMPRPRWVAQSCPILSCPCLAPDKNSRFCETARVWWVACAAAVLPSDKPLEHSTVRPVPRLSVGFLLPDSLASGALHIFCCARARVCVCVFVLRTGSDHAKTRIRPSGAEGMALSCRRWTKRTTPRSPLKR